MGYILSSDGSASALSFDGDIMNLLAYMEVVYKFFNKLIQPHKHSCLHGLNSETMKLCIESWPVL